MQCTCNLALACSDTCE